jgi:Uma2 family endonuclease
MSVVSIAEAWPAPGQPFTVAELERMPDDGRRYEVLDGVLVVSPRPANPHQEVAAELLGLLRAACPAGMRALPEPAVQISRTTEFAPDLVVIRHEQVTAVKCTEPPLLVVEVRSPSTALIGLDLKKAAYERYGVPSYWVVIPGPGKPELIVFELRKGRYEEAARAGGDEPFAATRPFAVEVIPARLVAGLQAPGA